MDESVSQKPSKDMTDAELIAAMTEMYDVLGVVEKLSDEDILKYGKPQIFRMLELFEEFFRRLSGLP